VRLHELLKDLGCPKAAACKPAALTPLVEPGVSVKLDAVMQWLTARTPPFSSKNVLEQYVGWRPQCVGLPVGIVGGWLVEGAPGRPSVQHPAGPLPSLPRPLGWINVVLRCAWVGPGCVVAGWLWRGQGTKSHPAVTAIQTRSQGADGMGAP
jgi:hypothetical protein